MADTVVYQAVTPATPPDATIIATDDAGAAGQVQLVKLAISTDGSATPIPADATNGIYANVKATVGLTDTQLRASAVPVSGTVTATGPLTDTELRATPVPVSGPLTDTELRAADVKITLDSEAVVLGAGTAEIGKLAAGTALIGKVGIDQATANANEVVVKSGTLTAVTTITNAVSATSTGNIADDSADSGNPVKVGGKAKAFDGTDPGSLAEDDRADFITDLNRRQYVNTVHPMLWTAVENNATAQTNNPIKAAPGAGLSLYVTDIIISADAAMNAKLVEDTGGSPVTKAGPYYFAANGGAGLHFITPIKLTADKDLGYTTSAAGNCTIEVHGFTAP